MARTPTSTPIRFTLKHLEYFIAAAEARSITLAAERIHISQPSISSAIAHLEMEFGTRLFIRQQGQGLVLTVAGERLRYEAQIFLANATSLHAAVSEVSASLSGPLTVGYLTTLAPYYAARLGLRFGQLNPNVAVRVSTGNQDMLFNRLRRAELDVAITYDMFVPKDLQKRFLTIVQLHVLTSIDHHLASATSVKLREIADEPYLLLDLPISRDYFTSLFLSDGLKPNVKAHIDDIGLLRTLVANGHGVSITAMKPPAGVAPDGTPLAVVPLDKKDAGLAIVFVTVKEVGPQRLIEEFMSFCRSQFELEVA